MRLSFKSLFTKIVFLAGVAGLACSYAYEARRPYFADRAARVNTEIGFRAAERIDPGNAVYPLYLGVYEFGSGDWDQGAAELRHAVALNPYMGEAWFQLANTYLVQNKSALAEQSLESGLRASPRNPISAWDAANTFLVQGNTDRAFMLYRVVMDYAPERTEQAVSTEWRATHDVERITRSLPDRGDAYIALVRAILSNDNDMAAAGKAWTYMVARRRPVDPKEAFVYIQKLLDSPNPANAQRAWAELLSIAPQLANYQVSDKNLIVNAGFEEALLNGGLDWRHQSTGSVTASIDTAQQHDGVASFILEFNGDPVGEAPIIEYVPVEPSRTYEMTGWVRTNELATADGPHVALIDAKTSRELYHSAEYSGTADWRPFKGEFSTDTNTTLIVVKILRDPGTRIKGQMWLDSFNLQRIR